MTSYRFKVQLDDVDIWCLEDILKEHIKKTYLENPNLRKMSKEGHKLRSEVVLDKLRQSMSQGLKSILESENESQDVMMDRYYKDMDNVNSVKKFIEDIKKKRD